MIEEKDLIKNFIAGKEGKSRKRERLPKPDWLKIKIGDPTNQNQVLKLIDGLNLHTVCQEARCPNIFECWTDKTATFMLGGDTCTPSQLEAAITPQDERAAAVVFQHIENRLYEVLEVVALLEDVHLLTQPGCPGPLVGESRGCY